MAELLKSLLRTCATSATVVLVMFWGWSAVIYFSGLEPILRIFGVYAIVLAPVIVSSSRTRYDCRPCRNRI